MTGRRAVRAALVAGCTLLLAACSGVPSSSTPERVRAVPNAPHPAQARPTPELNGGMAAIVSGYLQANVSNQDDHHSAITGFLTPGAKWSDANEGVVIVDQTDPGSADSSNNTVPFRAKRVATFDPATGTYTPDLSGDGGGGDSVSYTFRMQSVKGQWRIANPPPQLYVSLSDFELTYQPRPLYFYDQAEKHLVPDLRYSPFADPQQLANWQLTALLAGPPADLQSALVSEIPDQATSGKPTVTSDGSTLTVELPGTARLDAPSKTLLASQLAATFDQGTNVTITVTDGGKPVTFPQVGTSFNLSDYASRIDQGVSSPDLYYLDHTGAVVDAKGQAVTGSVSDYSFSSIALAQRSGLSDLLVAGVGTINGAQRLLTGTLDTVMKPVTLGSLAGPLTQPVWAPGLNEVWVGAGSSLYRVAGPVATKIPLTTSSGPVAGAVRAVLFSPEGTRVALVIRASGAVTSQVWVGAVSRTGTTVTISSLVPITPVGIVVNDASWSDPTTLVLVGGTLVDGATGISSFNVWSVKVDGSQLTPRSKTGLTVPPDSITTGLDAPPWVSAGGNVFEQPAGGWIAPDNKTSVRGTSPTYVE